MAQVEPGAWRTAAGNRYRGRGVRVRQGWKIEKQYIKRVEGDGMETKDHQSQYPKHESEEGAKGNQECGEGERKRDASREIVVPLNLFFFLFAFPRRLPWPRDKERRAGDKLADGRLGEWASGRPTYGGAVGRVSHGVAKEIGILWLGEWKVDDK
jgi:hypothetical protein